MSAKLPVFVIVTGCASTPAVNAAVASARQSTPVDVTTAVPVKFVLLFAPSAVMSALNAVPAVCCGMAPPPTAVTVKRVTTPANNSERGASCWSPTDWCSAVSEALVFVIVTARVVAGDKRRCGDRRTGQRPST